MMMTTKKLLEEAEFDKTKFRELETLVKAGESNKLEFKRKINDVEQVLTEMCAFANTTGGTLLIGVNDDGVIPGLKFPEEEAYVLHNALDKHCKPKIKFKESVIVSAPNRYVLQYTIPESRRKPQFFINAEGIKKVYVRHDDKTVQASREMREIIKRKRSKKNIQFNYSIHEELLMKYLHQHVYITMADYLALTKQKRYLASQRLITLVLAHVLDIKPTEKGDRYSLHKEFHS
jgi:predicted HTH transcriptional regulator